jgi:hypothetical protein
MGGERAMPGWRPRDELEKESSEEGEQDDGEEVEE